MTVHSTTLQGLSKNRTFQKQIPKAKISYISHLNSIQIAPKNQKEANSRLPLLMATLELKLFEKDGPECGLRGMIYNGNQVFSVFDFINLSCDKTRDSSYGRTNFYRLIKDGSEYKEEIESMCINVKFPGETSLLQTSLSLNQHSDPLIQIVSTFDTKPFDPLIQSTL